MQDVVLAALLVIDDELQRDARPARPIGERRRAAIADHVARIGLAPVIPKVPCIAAVGSGYDRIRVCSSPKPVAAAPIALTWASSSIRSADTLYRKAQHPSVDRRPHDRHIPSL